MILRYPDLAERLFERRPLLMLDALQLDVADGSAVGVKTVSINEAFFVGHFPGTPILPGVLQVAAMTQAAGAVLHCRGGEGIPWCLGLERIKFRSPVYPGDRLRVEVKMTAEAEDGVWFDGRIAVNGKVSCQGRVLMGRRTAETLYPAAGELPAALAVEATPGPAMDVNRIMECIPHRFPFLLVDRVLEMDMDALRILALKNVTANESFMEGCALPAMPGYLQCEAAAQAGCALALSIPENRDKLGFFMSIDTARFPAPVVAGEQVALEVEMVGRGRFGKADCVIRTGDGTCRATMELKFAIVDRE